MEFSRKIVLRPVSYAFFFVAFHSVLPVSELSAQAGPQNEAEDFSNLQAQVPDMSKTDAAQAANQGFKEERDRVLQTLEKEIRPNLPKADVDKLNRSVMRLGSYRSDWSDEAQKFLVANAAVAEPELYRYSMLKNQRLNRRILDTLNLLPTYRFPRAALAFSEFLGVGAEQKIKLVQLLARTTDQQPTISGEVINLLASNFGSDISQEYKLFYASRACAKIPKGQGSENSEAILRSWIQNPSSIWQRVLRSEIDACYRAG